MIIWLTGNTQAGKTTLARHLKTDDAIILDGDELRTVWKLGLSQEDRYEQNLRAARLAKILEKQGFVVIVALICPYEDLREQVKDITNCKFIYLKGGKSGKEFPYEDPENPDLILEKWSFKDV